MSFGHKQRKVNFTEEKAKIRRNDYDPLRRRRRSDIDIGTGTWYGYGQWGRPGKPIPGGGGPAGRR